MFNRYNLEKWFRKQNHNHKHNKKNRKRTQIEQEANAKRTGSKQEAKRTGSKANICMIMMLRWGIKAESTGQQ